MNDHVGGNAEEFDINGPSSFREDSPGSPFLKIGVGMLRDPDPNPGPYKFWKTYRRIASPTFRINQKDARTIVFEESLNSPETGHGYSMTSTVAVHPGGDGFTVHRKLTNSGSGPLRTEHYSHNFLRAGNRPIGSAYTLAWEPAIALQSEAPLRKVFNSPPDTSPSNKRSSKTEFILPPNRRKIWIFR